MTKVRVYYSLEGEVEIELDEHTVPNEDNVHGVLKGVPADVLKNNVKGSTVTQERIDEGAIRINHIEQQ